MLSRKIKLSEVKQNETLYGSANLVFIAFDFYTLNSQIHAKLTNRQFV